MPRKAALTTSVSALERGFAVLDCFAKSAGPLGNGEVAAATGLPKPTVYRLISTLVGLGQLKPVPGADRYELAAGVVHLAQAFLGGLDVRRHARPHLLAVAEACKASAFLGVRDGDQMLVVEAGRSRSAVAVLGSDIGTRMTLGTSALGRAWLAGLDEPARATVLAELRQRRAPGSGPALDGAIRDARRLGHALSLGEWHPDIHAVAVPVRTPSGEVVSLNCGGPAFVLTHDRLRQTVVPALTEAARRLAADIGGLAGLALTQPRPDAAEARPAPSDTPSTKTPRRAKETTR
jgi:DNA-binding IclR family transcriptional regulator